MTYKFTKDAERDLIELYVFGNRHFGEKQADQYFSELENCFQLLCEAPLICRERTEFNPPIRIHNHGSHIIIYKIQIDKILIIRILRDNMDIERHLK